MLGITDLSTYVIGVIAVILLPGPNSLFCLTVATQYGVRYAYQVVAAIVLGDSILILASVLGAGTLLRTHPQYFLWLKYIGAAYLSYIGTQLIRQAIQQWRSPRIAQLRRLKVSENKVFHKALALSLSNPKAILFFVAFFVQFVRVDYPHPYLSFLTLGIILQIISVLYLSILIFFGSRLIRAFSHHERAGALGVGAIGLLFLGFATTLISAKL